MSRPRKDIENPYVGRGGLKLTHALDAFAIDPARFVCADFGCNIGGFTDCLLQAGARQVYALDTGYGALDYRLRIDPRVVVMERTNALDVEPPESGVDLVVIDLAWTPQRRAIPAAMRWLAPTDKARIITLVKPHYEASSLGREELLEQGVLTECDALDILSETLDEMPSYGAQPIAVTRSPIVGGASRKRKTGNIEWLALVESMAETTSP